VREERDLDRRMNDFLGEESMFDEQDRRLRVRLSGDRVQVDRGGSRGGSPSFQEDSAGAPAGDPAPPPEISTPDDSVGPGPISPASSARASDRRPQVESVRAQALAAGGPVDLASLEAEAAKLEALARELDGRASTLEHRAQELEKR
jgi:hypothetical protein